MGGGHGTVTTFAPPAARVCVMRNHIEKRACGDLLRGRGHRTLSSCSPPTLTSSFRSAPPKFPARTHHGAPLTRGPSVPARTPTLTRPLLLCRLGVDIALDNAYTGRRPRVHRRAVYTLASVRPLFACPSARPFGVCSTHRYSAAPSPRPRRCVPPSRAYTHALTLIRIEFAGARRSSCYVQAVASPRIMYVRPASRK